MKKMFLIGDSIRFGLAKEGREYGYGYYVKKKLKGAAEVYQPDENCRFLQYTLRYLHEWAGKAPLGEIDVVHWNNGLWDLLHMFGDEVFTSPSLYEELLIRVYNRIKYLFPRTKIIFALNTPVIEELSPKDFQNCLLLSLPSLYLQAYSAPSCLGKIYLRYSILFLLFLLS